MYRMIYKYLDEKTTGAGVPRDENAAAHGHARPNRPLASNRCRFQGQAGDDGGGFCRRRSAQRSDRLLATRYMAESA